MSDRPPIFGQPAFGGAFTGAFGGSFSEQGGFNARAQGDLVLDLNSFSIGVPNSSPVSTWSNDVDPIEVDNADDATATGDNRPTFNATGINGKPSLTFDNATAPDFDFMTVGNYAGIQLASSFTAYVVCKPDGFAQLPTFFSKNGNLDYRFIFSDNGALRVILSGTGLTNSDRASTGTVPNLQPVIAEVHYQVTVGGTINWSANGTALAATQLSQNPNIDVSTEALIIGRTPSATAQNFKGEIGRILIYKNLLATDKRNNVIEGLGSQYGITVATLT